MVIVTRLNHTHDGLLEVLYDVEDVDVPVFDDDEILLGDGGSSERRPDEGESGEGELGEEHDVSLVCVSLAGRAKRGETSYASNARRVERQAVRTRV